MERLWTLKYKMSDLDEHYLKNVEIFLLIGLVSNEYSQALSAGSCFHNNC